jgi:EmrB/QacA subfamily drug resistance transporter
VDAKRGALVAAVLGSSIVTVDATAVNVALPTIADDLGGGLAGQQWVANAYLLTLASLILVSGSLSDVYGERRMFALGVGGFGLTSLLCALAPTVELLVVARGLQGVAGALLTPASLAIIVAVFPESERGAAIGAWTAWGATAYLVGPLLGGQIVDSASWRWVFALNVPLVLLTLAMTARIPATRARSGPREPLDMPGALLCAVGLAGISFGLIEQPMHGWDDPLVAVPLVGGILVFAAFILYELRAPAPMLPLDLFRRRAFAVANLETLLMYGGLAVQNFFTVIFLQQVAGFSALAAGSAGLVPTVAMFLFSRRAGALADRRGPRWFMAGGPLLMACGYLLLRRLDADASYVGDLLPALAVSSIGLALTVSPLTATVLSEADEHDAGIASAVNNAIARTAGLLATAAVGAVLATAYANTLDTELAGQPLSPAAAAQVEAARDRALAPVDPAAVPADERTVVVEAVQEAGVATYHLAATIAAGLLALAGLLGAVFLRNPRRREAAASCPGGQLAGAPRAAATAR